MLEYKKIWHEARAWAWQPFTGPGLAAFARAPLGWIALLQAASALIAGTVVAWAFAVAWAPAIELAASQVPGIVEFQDGRLYWPGTNAVRLSETPFLSLVVDPVGSGLSGQTADVQVEFGSRDVTVRGILGAATVPIPAPFHAAFDRLRATTGWAAWCGAFYLGIAAACLISLILSWWILATFYSVPTWIAGQLLGRNLAWTGAWRLAAAALIPGAAIMTAGIGLYALQWIRVPGLLLAMPAHLAAGWIWLLWGVASLETENETAGKAGNPFETHSPSADEESGGRHGPRRKRLRQNPFQPRR